VIGHRGDRIETGAREGTGTINRMTKPFLIVRRYPYEEPFHTHIEISASNGPFAGTTDVYCNVEDLAEIGNSLQQFPVRVGDEYRYEYGSENPVRRFHRYLSLRAYTTDAAGHCALQLRINNNTSEPNEGSCEFSIRAEAAAINRLGSLFERFSSLEHLELHWTLDDGELFAALQPQPA